jgi:hypothetical protein
MADNNDKPDLAMIEVYADKALYVKYCRLIKKACHINTAGSALEAYRAYSDLGGEL